MKNQSFLVLALSSIFALSSCEKQNSELSSDLNPITSSTSSAKNAAISLSAQKANDFITKYSGKADYNTTTKTLNITTSGILKMSGRTDGQESIYSVGTDVSKISIGTNVKVEAQFFCGAGNTLLIRGTDREKSIVFGTNTVDYKGNRAADFISFESTNGTKITIENLTSLNPKGFHTKNRSNSGGSQMTLRDCRFVDDRGGKFNNSDGNHDANLIERCYFETGDDVFCAYNGTKMVINNCTIKLVENTMPIQFGYEGASSLTNSEMSIKNLIVIGTGDLIGRNGPSFIQSLQKVQADRTNTVKTTKTINIDGLYFRPTNSAGVLTGRLINSDDNNIGYKGTWKNINVAINTYYKNYKSTSNMSICESTSKTQTSFFCGTPPKFADALK